MTRYDFIADFYDFLLGKVEDTVLLPIRKKYVPRISGITLDIAVGTGNNIAFYPKNSKVVLVDKSERMLKLAKKKSFERKDVDLKFICSPLENLPFENESFDTMLSIDVFCSVKDPKKVILELFRILKNDGIGIFIEHGKVESKIKNLLLYLTNIITYPTVGSSMTRTPLKYIKESKFTILEVENLKGTFKFISVKK
jgi:demethylmenaquinone methyltransferase/2-methoxy-6-polyprenyl-1,4-benzoquinol methylase